MQDGEEKHNYNKLETRNLIEELDGKVASLNKDVKILNEKVLGAVQSSKDSLLASNQV